MAASNNPLGGGQADYYSNENRIINFIARALGQLSTSEFQRSLAALEQPGGAYQTITVERLAWDGSYFTYASPGLFIKEPQSVYGEKTLASATQAQIAYAQNHGYAAWGLSDCFDLALGGYIQQGAPPAASPDALEAHPGMVAPHASALALISSLAAQAETNLITLQSDFPAVYEASYGFYDAVMVDPGSADYGLGFTALTNAAAVFIEGDIAYPEQAVFDGPMTAAELQQASRAGLQGCKTGDAVDDLSALGCGEDFSGIALDAEDLADVGEVQVAVEFGAGPDVTDFQPSVSFIGARVLRGEKRST